MADDHEHDDLVFQRSEVDAATLEALRDLHPDLAESLDLAQRWGELDAVGKDRLVLLQRKVEGFATWTPGFHAEGDRCAGCGKATAAVFRDVFDAGALPYGAFVANVPVHPDKACVAAFAKAHPRVSAQQVDRLRREFTRDLQRPTAGMSQFFRHDVFSHPPFALEDWANSVAEANQGKLDKTTQRDIERLLHWVHARLFHHHAH